MYAVVTVAETETVPVDCSLIDCSYASSTLINAAVNAAYCALISWAGVNRLGKAMRCPMIRMAGGDLFGVLGQAGFTQGGQGRCA